MKKRDVREQICTGHSRNVTEDALARVKVSQFCQTWMDSYLFAFNNSSKVFENYLATSVPRAS